MTGNEPASPTGPDHRIDQEIAELLRVSGTTSDADVIEDIVHTAVEMGGDHLPRLDLKMTRAVLAEMRSAFAILAPFADKPKVTIFGSARVTQDDPLWSLTRDLAQALAGEGWMVVTGAGGGIMHAGMEGAGAALSIGIKIRLPFEDQPNSIIAHDPKLVSMRYFFTRKVMLVKESFAFVCMPGGFGTLDETVELLTLQQTGKAEPTPIVLLDVPGGTYWHSFTRFIRDEVMSRRMVDSDDLERVLVTDSVEAARAEILHFWRNYHSLRWVGDTLVLRLKFEPTYDEVKELNSRFSSMVAQGRIERTGPLGPERDSADELGRPRIKLKLEQRQVGDLHKLIRALTDLPSANAAT